MECTHFGSLSARTLVRVIVIVISIHTNTHICYIRMYDAIYAVFYSMGFYKRAHFVLLVSFHSLSLSFAFMLTLVSGSIQARAKAEYNISSRAATTMHWVLKHAKVGARKMRHKSVSGKGRCKLYCTH